MMKYYTLLGEYLARGPMFPGMILHYCPACKDLHPYAVEKPFSNGAQWTFNNNAEKPSFSPSMKITCGRHICHYFVTDGNIIYCGDSTHEYAGKTLPLEPIPQESRDLEWEPDAEDDEE